MSRILLLVSHPFMSWKNGADIAALQLARQLVARGHEVALEIVLMDAEAALSEWRGKVGAGADSFSIGDVPAHVRSVPVPDADRPREIREHCARAVDAAAAAAIAACDPDVVLVPWGTLSLARAARAHHDRVIVWVQSGEAVDGLNADNTRGLSLATVSADLARRINKRVGRAPRVILNAIDVDALGAADGGVRDRIGMVNFCAEKGAVVFLNLAANLPDTSFVATGGWAGRALDYTAMTTGLDNVEITPPFDRIAEFYRQLRLLVVPSLWREAFGRVVIEAQACGVPVVCTSRCGAREWVEQFVVPVRKRPKGVAADSYYHDATLHADTIRGFLDAIVTLDDPDNHAIAVDRARAAAARYRDAQIRSVEKLERWVDRQRVDAGR